MITIFLICMLLIFLIYKYASLAILFIFDFVVLGIGSYVFLKSKIGNDSAIIATIIILLAYGAILLFTNKKISILGKIMNYIASLVGSIIGTEIIISLTTSLLKGIGIFENSYSSLVLTHNKFVDDIINFILAIIVSIFVYKKRMNFINDKFEVCDNIDDLDEENYKFYQEYMQNKNRYLNTKSEKTNNLYNESECENKEENYYISKHIYNTKLGELGEEFVYNIEKNSVAVFNKDFADKVEHVSKLYGDKLGYDISSIDINGNNLKIEVKTTTGDCDTPFYISKNELRFLKENENDGAILYRVYNFNEETKTGQIKKITAQEILNNYDMDTKQYFIQKKESENNINEELEEN